MLYVFFKFATVVNCVTHVSRVTLRKVTRICVKIAKIVPFRNRILGFVTWIRSLELYRARA